MAASTIGRSTLSDGSSGTVLNNSLWQSSIYDKVDALIAANITFGGTVSAEGVGTHSFSAGGSGGNVFNIRNTTSGTTNFGAVYIGNDSSASLGELSALSSTFTTSSEKIASALAIRSNGAGGVSIACTQTGGATGGSIRLYPGNTLSGGWIFDRQASNNIPTLSWLANSLGARIMVGDTSTSDAIAVLQAGEPGVAAANVVVGNNYYGTTTGGSDRRNTSIGASYARFGASANPTFAVGFVTSGGAATTPLSITTSVVSIISPMQAANGSAGGPSYSFTNETNTGVFLTSPGASSRLSLALRGAAYLEVSNFYNSSGASGAFLPDAAVGTGAKSGGMLTIGRNTSGSGAAGTLQLLDRAAGQWFIWSDAGTLRINGGSFPLENDSTVAHTGGTVIGTQTSSRDSKIVLGQFGDTTAALDLVRRIPLYRWRYRQGSQALQNEEFVGVITDETPEFGMDRDEAHPGGKSLNVPSAIGYLIAAVQEQQRIIDMLQERAA